jgi:3-oxoacyl-ACP reductase-like protein
MSRRAATLTPLFTLTSAHVHVSKHSQQGNAAMTAEQQAPFGSGFGYRSTAADVLKGIDLKDKNVIVTGGYSGIGIEAVRALVNAGASVTVPARRPDKAR